MMDVPLTVTSIMRYGTTTFRGKQVVTNTGEGVRRPTWGERPFAAVVVRDGAEVSAEHLRDHLAASVPRWQLPERWAYIDEVPKTSVGKFSKRMMRAAYAHGEYKVIQVG
jgi:fatty-acyl-CoA synthase